MSKEIAKGLVTRWSTNKPGIEEALSKVLGWTDDQTDLTIHLLGWLATKTDEEIQQEAVEMVGALETVAQTRNITQKGEDFLTDVVHGNNQQGGGHHDHQQEGCAHARARETHRE